MDERDWKNELDGYQFVGDEAGEDIDELIKSTKRELEHNEQIRNLQGIHNQELEIKDKEISRLNTILEKAFNWFPLLKEMLRMENLPSISISVLS